MRREDVVDNGNRTAGGHNYRGRSQNDGFQMDDSGRQAANLAAAAAAAAAEATRRLEREKAQIQAEAKRREEELMNTIRQQQQQLQRLQQAAALAEQKAKVNISFRLLDFPIWKNVVSKVSRFLLEQTRSMAGWNKQTSPFVKVK